MKGVILAGGLGTRLRPMTKVTNKHLLPVNDLPMIFYPIKTLVQAGITDLLIVTGGNDSGDFLKLLGNGAEFGLSSLYYAYQQGEGGIADALKLAERFIGVEKFVVMLGDNITNADISKEVEEFKKVGGARILLHMVEDPCRFGVITFKNGMEIKKITEKPKNPDSNYIVTGIYMYNSEVFGIAKSLSPSGRGELEITDVNTAYLSKDKLSYGIIKGWWTDAGTLETLRFATEKLREKK